MLYIRLQSKKVTFINVFSNIYKYVTMKQIIILIRVIAAIMLITLGVNNLSEPSNVEVAIGVFEIILGLAIVFKPITNLFKKI